MGVGLDHLDLCTCKVTVLIPDILKADTSRRSCERLGLQGVFHGNAFAVSCHLYHQRFRRGEGIVLECVLKKQLQRAGDDVSVRGIVRNAVVYENKAFREADLHEFPVIAGKFYLLLYGNQPFSFLFYQVTVDGGHLVDVGAGFLPVPVLDYGIQYVETVEQEVGIDLVLEGHIPEFRLMAAGSLAGCLPLHADSHGDHICEGEDRCHHKQAHHHGILEDISRISIGQIEAEADNKGNYRYEEYLMLFPGLRPFIFGRSLFLEYVGKAVEAPSKQLCHDDG